MIGKKQDGDVSTERRILVAEDRGYLRVLRFANGIGMTDCGAVSTPLFLAMSNEAVRDERRKQRSFLPWW